MIIYKKKSQKRLCWKSSWNASITSSWRTKHFFAIILPLLSLSSMLSHNSHILLYLNGLKTSIEHLYMFFNKWNLIIWRDAVKKQWSCSDDYKYGAFILRQSKQQFKIQSHFGIFDPVLGEVQWYDDAASHALKFICELFGNILFLYSMK